MFDWLKRRKSGGQAVELPALSARDLIGQAGALLADGKMAEAAGAYRRVLALEPANVDAHANLGVALAWLGDYAAAVASFESALRIDPRHAMANLNRSLALLTLGDFDRGWAGFEWRWQRAELQTIRSLFTGTWWDGSALDGKTILLFAEQGFGDAIQFVRYASLVAAMGARVVVDCHPQLRTLFRSVPGVAKVLDSDAEIGAYDLCCPLMSLPGLLKTTLQTAPAKLPYLAPAPGQLRSWRARVDANPRATRVGLVWASKLETGDAWRKSFPLDTLQPLASVKGLSFYSLQMGAGANPGQACPDLNLIDLTADLHDFSDTAALLSAMDLVISIDTAVAHLAGALGKTTWTLLPKHADWRWLLEREDCPWYPGMRLFRQQAEGDWDGVIRQVAAELRAFTAART